MTSQQKPKTNTSPPTRLIVKKEIIRTSKPVTYDGKRLNDALNDLLWHCFGLFVVGMIAAIIGVLVGAAWLFGIGFTECIVGGYGILRYMNVWEGDKEDEKTVEEQLYVELPTRKR